MKKYLFCKDVTKVVLERMDSTPEEFYEGHLKCRRWKVVFDEVYDNGNLAERLYLSRAKARLKEAEMLSQAMAVMTYDPSSVATARAQSSTRPGISNFLTSNIAQVNSTIFGPHLAKELLEAKLQAYNSLYSVQSTPFSSQLFAVGAPTPYQAQDYSKSISVDIGGGGAAGGAGASGSWGDETPPSYSSSPSSDTTSSADS